MSTTLQHGAATESRTHRRPTRGTVAAAAGRSIGRRLASLLATVLLVTAVVALLGVTVAPRVFHYRTATMLTGSMAPHIKPGDVIVDTQEPAADVKIGQIITYHIPVDDHRVESHRVVWVGHDSHGRVLIRTQGDANSGADPWTARLDSAKVWQVRTVVPMAGTVIRALRTPWVHILLVLVLPALLIFALLVMIWAPGERRDEDETGEQAQPSGELSGPVTALVIAMDEPVAERVIELDGSTVGSAVGSATAPAPADAIVSEAAGS